MSGARSLGVIVDSLPDGTAVAVKRFAGEGAVAAVERESDVLRAAAHPGVPRLIEVRVDPVAPALVLELVGTRSLASSPPQSLDNLCAVLAGLCRVVADLHERGICHGQLEPDHVILRNDSTAALCGFGAASLDSGVDDRAVDVAGLGTLMRQVLPDHLRIEGAPRRGRLLAARGGYRERSLLNLADQAILDEASARPSARALADSVETVTASEVPRRRPPMAIVACLASAVMLAVALPRLSDPVGDDDVAPRSTIPLPTGTSVGSPATAPSDAPRLVHRGVTYSAGEPGDTLIPEVRCDGSTSAVMLRAGDHTLWHFADWAGAGAPEPAVHVADAIAAIETVPDDRCDAVLATDRDGRSRWVSLRDGPQ